MNATALVDLEPPPSDFQREFLEGLERSPKTVSPKFLYDARGSELFEQICELEAYYPTRTELSIMDEYAGEMAGAVGAGARVVEFGSGSGKKTRLLLEHLDATAAYLPIDISRSALRDCASRIRERFPDIPVIPVCGDYTSPLDLPDRHEATRTVAYFPGSTIGNFEPAHALAFLQRIRKMCAPDGGLLIGVDLDKPRDILERAYDDPEGVTAAFNLNLLRRANRELGADFDPEAFEHRAIFNEEASRIEMHLVSRRDQRVEIGDVAVGFEADEPIVTEHSYKYTPARFARYAEQAGFEVTKMWTDSKEMFSEWFLSA